MAQATTLEQQVPTRITESVTAAFIKTFESIFEATPVLRTTPGEIPAAGVVALIPFTGDLALTVALGAPRETIVAMVEAFVGIPIEFESDDMGDAASELTNVVAGDIVVLLEQAGWNVQMGLPAVTRGMIEMLSPTDATHAQVVLTFGLGDFWVRVETRKNGA